MTDEYSVGDLASLLKPKAKGKRNKKLKSLFGSAAKLQAAPSQLFKAVPTQLLAKRKADVPAKECSNDQVYAEETDIEVNKSTKKSKTKKRKLAEEDDDDGLPTAKKSKTAKYTGTVEENERTVFVGNVPTATKVKDIRKIFTDCGTIETIRFRCVPVADPKVPKKVAIIKQEFHPERHNINAYVKFEMKDSAEAALKKNGHELNGFHIRVDLAGNSKVHNHKKSVFVGNLPFNIEEEAMIKHFQQCGQVEGIRIIREPQTGIGKGFGYVLFKAEDAVGLALQLDGKPLLGRYLRIKRSVKKMKNSKPYAKPEVNDRKSFRSTKRTQAFKANQRNLSAAKSNDTFIPGNNKNKAKVERYGTTMSGPEKNNRHVNKSYQGHQVGPAEKAGGVKKRFKKKKKHFGAKKSK